MALIKQCAAFSDPMTVKWNLVDVGRIHALHMANYHAYDRV